MPGVCKLSSSALALALAKSESEVERWLPSLCLSFVRRLADFEVPADDGWESFSATELILPQIIS